MNRIGACGWAAMALVMVTAGCSDDDETNGTGNPGSSSSSTGAAGPGGAGGSGATGAEGGAGGSGATGGGDVGGGGSGGGTACLPATDTDAYFTVASQVLCAVARYDAPALTVASYGVTPSWGAHDGLLTYASSPTGITLQRWAVNGTGLTSTDESLEVTIPANAFWGPQAVDFTGASGAVTAVAWSGAMFTEDGAMVLVSAGALESTETIGVLGLASRGDRLLWTGLAPAGGTTAADNALYAGVEDELTLVDDGTIDVWGGASGPIAVDALGHTVAIMTDFGTSSQELRAYAAANTTVGGGEVDGVPLATLDGFGDALAAMAPTDTAPGIVAFQPNDGVGVHQDVVAIGYEIAGGVIAPVGQPSPMLELTTADDNVTLVTDGAGRLWVGIANAEGGDGSVFFVLDRK